jgi:O-methyltransferase involved in polyketide biosynthesis
VDRLDWASPEIDVERPSVARMYDYYLGGSHNFAADRRAAEAVIAAVPDVADGCRANRAFLRRVVREMVAAGVRQFVDIGSGIPTVGNVHSVAQRQAPDARVVYVDIDPVAVAHSRQLLTGNDRVAVLQADLREPRHILTHPDLTGLVDLTRPVALMLFGVLHFVSDEENPAGLLAILREALVPGSYLAISHGTGDSRPREAREATEVYQRTANPLTVRGRAEVAGFFAGYELLDPGLVWLSQWRPEDQSEIEPHPERHAMIGGVGRRQS